MVSSKLAAILAAKRAKEEAKQNTAATQETLAERLARLKKEQDQTVTSAAAVKVTQVTSQDTVATAGIDYTKVSLNDTKQIQSTTATTASVITQTEATSKLKARLASIATKSNTTPVPSVEPVRATVVPVGTQLTMLEKLKLKLAKQAEVESKLATDTGHANGTLPVDEEIVCSIDLVSHDEVDVSNVNKTTVGMNGEVITYNERQQRAVTLGGSGQSFVLIGAAGTGKTTCSKGSINAIVQNHKTGVLSNDGHKYLPNNTPGIIIISYTRRAVNNIRKVQDESMKNNCITSHKLLEYEPVYIEMEDPITGKSKRTMRFEPARNSSNCLPTSISTIVVEEASMLSVDLYSQITDALAHEVQWIFIGDIQQLPPVFGSAILGFKMLELEVVELTEVYRQALESPIIKLAHRILSGVPIKEAELKEWSVPEKLHLHPWKKRLSDEDACKTLAAFFRRACEEKAYDPEEDIILIPYNQACGTIEINRHIANFLARQRDEVTYEVMAGFNKHYFSVGDKVLYDKEDAVIVHIEKNSAYAGKRVQAPSRALDYWGCNQDKSKTVSDDFEDFDIDAILDAVAVDSEERVTQASHKITVRLDNSMVDVTLSKAGEINNILLGYAITVHKSQGSEWRKVFFCLHHSHSKMCQRELLYTGVTRARESLYVICEPDSFVKGILNQKIKGNTLAEKAEFFKGKVKEGAYSYDEAE